MRQSGVTGSLAWAERISHMEAACPHGGLGLFHLMRRFGGGGGEAARDTCKDNSLKDIHSYMMPSLIFRNSLLFTCTFSRYCAINLLQSKILFT